MDRSAPGVPVEIIPVSSEPIEALGYDAGRRQLYVRYRASGATYVYEEVEEAFFQQFLAAPSKGWFLSRWVVDRFLYRKFKN